MPELPSFRERLHQSVLNVRVVVDTDGGGHLVRQLEELLPGRDGHEDVLGSVLGGQLREVDGVMDRIN